MLIILTTDLMNKLLLNKFNLKYMFSVTRPWVAKIALNFTMVATDVVLRIM